MRTEQELLVDCLERLNRLGIPYMLVGSMASNYWGIPRSTHDLDFVLVLRHAEVDRFVEAFGADFFLQPESVRRALVPPRQFNAIDEHSALKVDFWLLKDEAFDRAAFARRQQATLFGTEAWIMSAEDVILHKLYWNSLSPSDRQLLDAAGVYAVQSGALDVLYLRQWASMLGVEQTLDDILTGRLKPKAT